MTAAALILTTYAAALAAIFYGFFVGWFDIRVTEIINGHTIRLSTGKTLTMAGPGHEFSVGQRVSLS